MKAVPVDWQERSEVLRLCVDEQQIRDACMCYWAGFDRRHADLFLRAFTADAIVSLFDGKLTMPVAQLVEQGGLNGAGFEHTSHTPGSQVIVVDGDSATADTLVTAVLVPAEGPVAVRGLRYRDDLLRTDVGWRINHRHHSVLWQYDADRVEPHTSL